MNPFGHRAVRPDLAQIASRAKSIAWTALESIVHLDPAGRGLASFRCAQTPLDAGQLRSASIHLARHGVAVGIVTGFCVAAGGEIMAETDGPPGALFLARALDALGIEVVLISDSHALPLLKAGCNTWHPQRVPLLEFPFEDPGPAALSRWSNDPQHNTESDRWVETFFSQGPGQRLSHLIAIERPGPSHTLDSLLAQARRGAAPVERFLTEVRAEDRDICHNMHGASIQGRTAKTHRLFEAIAHRRLPITTIGIGDGGNELGMGRFAWEILVEAIGQEPAGRMVCRVATDFALIAGVSNWAAYALALAVARLRGADTIGRNWNLAREQALIETIVRQTTAVDGVTLRHEPTVDGLPLEVYLQPLGAMRQLLGFADGPGP